MTQQGKVAGDYLAKHFKGEKIAILNDNTAYGKGLADETTKALHAAGGKEALTAPTRLVRRTTRRWSAV